MGNTFDSWNLLCDKTDTIGDARDQGPGDQASEIWDWGLRGLGCLRGSVQGFGALDLGVRAVEFRAGAKRLGTMGVTRG